MSKWFEAAIIRALRTIAQTAIATIGTAMTMGEVNWLLVASTSVLAGILSMLMSVAGLPEVDMYYANLELMGEDEDESEDDGEDE